MIMLRYIATLLFFATVIRIITATRYVSVWVRLKWNWQLQILHTNCHGNDIGSRAVSRLEHYTLPVASRHTHLRFTIVNRRWVCLTARALCPAVPFFLYQITTGPIKRASVPTSYHTVWHRWIGLIVSVDSGLEERGGVEPHLPA